MATDGKRLYIAGNCYRVEIVGKTWKAHFQDWILAILLSTTGNTPHPFIRAIFWKLTFRGWKSKNLTH
jgi:hypothetical protein